MYKFSMSERTVLCHKCPDPNCVLSKNYLWSIELSPRWVLKGRTLISVLILHTDRGKRDERMTTKVTVVH